METIKRTKIVDALQRTDFGATVNVKGWVRTHRSSKAVDFIALNDGSTIKNIQIVVDPAKFDAEQLKQITTGACISAVGTLVESQGKGQSSEIQCESLEIYGLCGSDYPMQKKGQSFEYMRQYAHLRLRTNTFGAVMRIRHNMAMAIHTYFHEHGYFYFHTPLITASDCEGAGQMFQVTTKNLYNLKKTEDGKIDYSDDFFGKQTSLTVSGQLEGELGATALGAIYTFGPTFRAENSNTPRHLAEFWMVEPEVAFLDLAGLMDLEEDFIKYCIRWALEHCKDDLEFLNKMIDKGLSGSFAVAGGNQWCVEIEETMLMEVLVDGNSHVVANAHHSTESIGTQTEVCILAHHLKRLAFLLHGISVIAETIDFQGLGLNLTALTSTLTLYQNTSGTDTYTSGNLLEHFFIKL